MRPRDLNSNLIKQLQSCNEVTSSAYITLNRNKLERLIRELYKSDDKWLEAKAKEIIKLLQTKNALLNCHIIKSIVTTLGEIDCYLLCKSKEIPIEPNDEGQAAHGVKRADFIIKCSDGDLYLEVKTPGPYNMELTVEGHLNKGAEVNATLQAKIAAGETVATEVQVIPFWKPGFYNNPSKYVAQYYIEKINNNFKSGQFLDDTVMVVNTMWSPYVPDIEDLFRYTNNPYPDFEDSKDPGKLWMVGFGTMNSKMTCSTDMIASSERTLDKEGVFKNSDNDKLKGVIFLGEGISQNKLQGFGLIRGSVKIKWLNGHYSNKKLKKWEVFNLLCEERWNDENESNSDNLKLMKINGVRLD